MMPWSSGSSRNPGRTSRWKIAGEVPARRAAAGRRRPVVGRADGRRGKARAGRPDPRPRGRALDEPGGGGTEGSSAGPDRQAAAGAAAGLLLHALEGYATDEIAMLQDRPESEVKADIAAARRVAEERPGWPADTSRRKASRHPPWVSARRRWETHGGTSIPRDRCRSQRDGSRDGPATGRPLRLHEERSFSRENPP